MPRGDGNGFQGDTATGLSGSGTEIEKAAVEYRRKAFLLKRQQRWVGAAERNPQASLDRRALELKELEETTAELKAFGTAFPQVKSIGYWPGSSPGEVKSLLEQARIDNPSNITLAITYYEDIRDSLARKFNGDQASQDLRKLEELSPVLDRVSGFVDKLHRVLVDTARQVSLEEWELFPHAFWKPGMSIAQAERNLDKAIATKTSVIEADGAFVVEKRELLDMPFSRRNSLREAKLVYMNRIEGGSLIGGLSSWLENPDGTLHKGHMSEKALAPFRETLALLGAYEAKYPYLPDVGFKHGMSHYELQDKIAKATKFAEEKFPTSLDAAIAYFETKAENAKRLYKGESDPVRREDIYGAQLGVDRDLLVKLYDFKKQHPDHEGLVWLPAMPRMEVARRLQAAQLEFANQPAAVKQNKFSFSNLKQWFAKTARSLLSWTKKVAAPVVAVASSAKQKVAAGVDGVVEALRPVGDRVRNFAASAAILSPIKG